MNRLARILYWKLCFPRKVRLIPPKFNVMTGPFRGMAYLDVAHCSLISPKILGTYEKELHPIIDEILSTPYDRIVDIGAAEGYYAVGLAFARPDLADKIVAFEAEPAARDLLQALARRNGIAKLRVYGRCEPDKLAQVLAGAGRKLVICDVEGFEGELLDPRLVPGLRDASLLVELHDFYRERVSEVIRQAFHSTHQIQEVVSMERTWEDFPVDDGAAKLLPRSIALRAMHEGRPPRMTWFWMRPAAPDIPQDISGGGIEGR